jgi:alkylation response protein AidB-like acyl-CoA dehydrogenase
VDIRLSAEQEMFAAAAADIAAEVSGRWSLGRGPDTVSRPEPDARSWHTIADAGLLSLRLAESAGGSEATCLDACIVAEQLGRHCVPAPALGTLLLVEQLRLSSAGQDLIEPIATGRDTVAIALNRDLRGFATEPDLAVAVDCAGAKTAVVVGDQAAFYPIEARPSADLSRAFGGLDTSAGPCRSVALAGPQYPGAADRLLSFALSLVAADLLGVMQAALDGSVAHAKARTQFGAPIGSFQAIAHLAAECLVSVEATRSAVWYAAWATDNLPPAEAVLAARAAKAFASAAGVEVTQAAVQIHGGMGMTWEAPPHLWLRRAHTSRRLFGDENAQYDAIAGAQLGQPGTEV